MPKEAINSQEIQVRMQKVADEIKMIPKIDPPPIIPKVIDPQIIPNSAKLNSKMMNTPLIPKLEDLEWLLSQLPQKPKAIDLLFSSAIHGWKQKDWAKAVGGKTQTITLMKTTKGKVCGGYLHIGWDQNAGGKDGDDS